MKCLRNLEQQRDLKLLDAFMRQFQLATSLEDSTNADCMQAPRAATGQAISAVGL